MGINTCREGGQSQALSVVPSDRTRVMGTA